MCLQITWMSEWLFTMGATVGFLRFLLVWTFKPVLRIRIRIRIRNPDPHVFWPPRSGSGSISQRYGSGSKSGSFYHQAKIIRKTLIPTALTSFWLFIFQNDVNAPSKRNKQKTRIRIRIRIRIHSEAWIRGSRSGAGSTPKCHGSATLFQTFAFGKLRHQMPIYPETIANSSTLGFSSSTASIIRIGILSTIFTFAAGTWVVVTFELVRSREWPCAC